MPNPRIPHGFKPLIEGYNIGAPSGVLRTQVEGGLARSAMDYDRGPQRIAVSLYMSPEKFSVWSYFFLKLIDKGAISFYMPLDTGTGVMDHLCTMDSSTYSVAKAGRTQAWRVAFAVDAESPIFDATDDEAQAVIDLWNGYGESSDDLLRRLERFANVDTTVLDF
ncbi:hypothetical protein [Variovorax paradoxus]|uniref:hypothetical protein n=1 Tax=Variovorax paradoxus TaxID=34073 RepID=UPI001934712A|nr:hypothetical protein INQ48_20405 [Variovorax paradoxus]